MCTCASPEGECAHVPAPTFRILLGVLRGKWREIEQESQVATVYVYHLKCYFLSLRSVSSSASLLQAFLEHLNMIHFPMFLSQPMSRSSCLFSVRTHFALDWFMIAKIWGHTNREMTGTCKATGRVLVRRHLMGTLILDFNVPKCEK